MYLIEKLTLNQLPFICEKNFLIIIIYAFISFEQRIHYYKL